MKTKDNKLFLVILGGIIASLFFAWFIFTTGSQSGSRILNSPDETANLFFATQFVKDGSFFIEDSLNNQFGNIIHPRSTVSRDGKISALSFMGIIFLYGLLGKIFSASIIMYLTVIISFFATLCFYFFIKNIFNKNIAFVSSILLIIFPAWQYYNSRSMFHNVLFVDAIIFFLYFFSHFFKKQKLYALVFSALFLAIAVMVRTSEVVWLGALVLGLGMVARKNIRLLHFGIFTAVFFFSLIPFAYYNQQVYGEYVSFGYNITQLEALQNTPSTVQSETNFFSILFPFGFHPKRAWTNTYNYLIKIFWWYSIPIVLGVFAFLKNWKHQEKSQKIYFISLFLITFYLSLFYGSWRIVDNLDPTAITIGTSYIRYWLVIFIFALPFFARGIIGILGAMRSSSLKKGVGVLIFSLLIYFSVHRTWFSSPESLLPIKKTIHNNYQKRTTVEHLVEANSIIVADRSDKIFFPTFKVINELKGDEKKKNIKKLVSEYPVYYYTFLSDSDVEKMRQSLAPFNLELMNERRIFENERLFNIQIID